MTCCTTYQGVFMTKIRTLIILFISFFLFSMQAQAANWFDFFKDPRKTRAPIIKKETIDIPKRTLKRSDFLPKDTYDEPKTTPQDPYDIPVETPEDPYDTPNTPQDPYDAPTPPQDPYDIPWALSPDTSNQGNWTQCPDLFVDTFGQDLKFKTVKIRAIHEASMNDVLLVEVNAYSGGKIRMEKSPHSKHHFGKKEIGGPVYVPVRTYEIEDHCAVAAHPEAVSGDNAIAASTSFFIRKVIDIVGNNIKYIPQFKLIIDPEGSIPDIDKNNNTIYCRGYNITNSTITSIDWWNSYQPYLDNGICPVISSLNADSPLWSSYPDDYTKYSEPDYDPYDPGPDYEDIKSYLDSL